MNATKNLPNPTTVQVQEWKETWKRYFPLSLIIKKAYKVRLNEIESWDKPRVSRENDKDGRWNEWEGKILALKELLNG